MAKPRKPRAARVATASNPEVLAPEPQAFATPEEGEAAFHAALRNLADTFDRARTAGALFSPVTGQLVQAVKYQVQFLDIGASRRARAAQAKQG